MITSRSGATASTAPANHRCHGTRGRWKKATIALVATMWVGAEAIRAPLLVGRPDQRENDASEAVVIVARVLVGGSNQVSTHLAQDRNVVALQDGDHITLTVRHTFSQCEKCLRVSCQQ